MPFQADFTEQAAQADLLAAAAVVVAATAAAVTCTHQAVVATAAEQNEQNDDPAAVAAPTVITHKKIPPSFFSGFATAHSNIFFCRNFVQRLHIFLEFGNTPTKEQNLVIARTKGPLVQRANL